LPFNGKLQTCRHMLSGSSSDDSAASAEEATLFAFLALSKHWLFRPFSRNNLARCPLAAANGN
jgi:hypothetical protein